MTEKELKDAVLKANLELSTTIAAARAAGITVNLWVKGTGPTSIGLSEIDVGFDS